MNEFEIARTSTNTNTSDEQIRTELKSIDPITKIYIIAAVNGLLATNPHFDLLGDALTPIANKYSISPATLFCIYMNSVSK